MTAENGDSLFWKYRWLLGAVGVVAFVAYRLFSNGLGSPNWYVSSVAFSPDGKIIAVGIYRWQRAPYESTPRFLISGVEHTVKLIDAATGKELQTIELTYSEV